MGCRDEIMTSPPAILIIAASDSSGGAGLARDLRVAADCGVTAGVALTAVTVQSDRRVHAVHPVPTDVVRAQIAAVLETRDVRAIKVGMLATRAVVEAVIESLPLRERVAIVLDPVLESSSGYALLDEDGRAALRTKLCKQVTVITPNIPEAAILLNEQPAWDEATQIEQARRLQRLGVSAVLLKGGHAEGTESVDLLVEGGKPTVRFIAPRVAANMRGTGCALSSAIAAALARGMSLEAACGFAKCYVTKQLETSARPEWHLDR